MADNNSASIQPQSFERMSLIPISAVNENTNLQSSFINGVVSLLWPYSSSRHEFSILLGEEDILERINRGQIKLTFLGRAIGKALESKMQIGDIVKVSLAGSNITANDDLSKSESDSDWKCVWDSTVLIQVREFSFPILMG